MCFWVKYLMKSNLTWGKFALTHSLKGCSPSWQKYAVRARGSIHSQETRQDAGAQFTSPSPFILLEIPFHDMGVFLLQSYISMCSLDHSKSCHIDNED